MSKEKREEVGIGCCEEADTFSDCMVDGEEEEEAEGEERSRSEVEDYLSEIGLGRFPLLMYGLCSVTEMMAAWQWMSASFIHYQPPHHCALENTTGHLNDTIPWEYDEDGGVWRQSQCLEFSPFNTTQECSRGYTFTGNQGTTAASERFLNMILALSVFFLGILFGCLTLPTITDQLGRKRMATIYLGLVVPFGVGASLVSSWQALAAVKFFIFYFISGATNSIFTLVCEYFPKQHRSLAGNGFWFFWAAGYMMVPLFAYYIRDWRHLQLAITLPLIPLTVVFAWLIPESPRFLLRQGRAEDVEKILQAAANTNGKNIQVDLHSPESKVTDGLESAESSSDDSSIQDKKYTLLDVIRTKHFRSMVLLLTILWPINSLVYYGLSLNTSALAGDRYINAFLSGAVEVPAYLSAILLIKYCGRRMPISAFHFIAGASLLALMLVPSNSSGTIPTNFAWLQTSLSMLGKFGITASYGAIYLFTTELYPTVVRNAGLGFCSTMARVGGIMAPYTIYFSETSPLIQPILFGSLAMLGSVIVLMMPETAGRALPDTLGQVSVPWLTCFGSKRQKKCKYEVADTKSPIVV